MIANRNELFAQIQKKESFLCVGLDPDLDRIPTCCGEGVEAIENFCKDIISKTQDHAVAYKPNLAFFEQCGSAGFAALERVVSHIPSDCMVIADAKRGDIGNTASRYADAMFNGLGADAVTVAPYMGADSVKPFLESGEGRWTILLALTSNPGAEDFEFHGEPPLFERVLDLGQSWGTVDNLMFVIGATRPERLAAIRKRVPDHFFLVPGVGAQGGTVDSVARVGMNDKCGLLVNSSRGILYAGKGEDFAERAGEAAKSLQTEMAGALRRHGIL
ncbi:MAG: orotidine-5'-phosphate decarboxylase [Flavobacteriales bacterium]